MRIGIDCDGVLSNFNEKFIEKIIEVTGKDLFPPRPFDIPTWHYPQVYGYTEAEMDFFTGPVWGAIKQDPEFWYMLPAYDDTRAFLEKLDCGWHDIYFVTHRAGVNVKMQTEAWLEFNGYGLQTPNFCMPTVLLSGDKGSVAKALDLDLYIDDKTENCLDVNHASPKTQVIMMNRSWNASDYHVVRRVNTLDEFSKFIEPF